MFYSQLSKTKFVTPVPPPPKEKWETVPEQTPCDSESEKKALHDLIISSEPGSGFAVHGKPGTGKTLFVNNSHDEKGHIGLIPKLENKGLSYICLAPTNKASRHLKGGMTFHAHFGLTPPPDNVYDDDHIQNDYVFNTHFITEKITPIYTLSMNAR